MLAVTRTVPETVPVSSTVVVVNTAVVPFAGTVKETVLEPFENITPWSSMGTTTLFDDVNESFSEPDIGLGCGGEIVKPMNICSVGWTVSGTFVRDNV